MAAKDMKAQIKITADGKQAVTALNSITGALGKVRKSIFNLKSLVVGGLTTLGVKKFADAILDAGREVEQLEIKIDRIAGAGSGEKIYRQFNDIAVQAGVTGKKLADFWVGLANAGIQLSESAVKSIADVGNVLGEDVYGFIATQMVRIKERGEIGREELEQFAQAGIDARGILEDAFAMPVDKLKEKGVDAKAIIDTLASGMGKSFKDGANDVGQSWDGTMALMAAKWDAIKLKIADAGTFDMFKAGLQTVNELIDKVFDSDAPDKWAQIIAAGAEYAVPLLYGGLTKAATGVLRLAQGFQSLNYIFKSIQTAYYESQANAERAQADHAQKQVKYLQSQLQGLDNTSKKYQNIAKDLETWQARLTAAQTAQTEYNQKADDGQKRVNELAKAIENTGDEIERFKELTADGAAQLEARLKQIKYLSNITETEVLRLQAEAEVASTRAAALMAQITSLTNAGLKAPADLLTNYTKALTEATLATMAHRQALASYTGKNNAEGLTDDTIVKSTLGGLNTGGIDTAKQMALAQARAQAEMLKLVSEAAINDLNNLLEDGLISVKDYYDKRRAELKTQYEAELALLDEQLRLTTDRVERFNLEQEKTRLTFSFNMADADMQREAMQREADLAKEKAALLRDIEIRAMEDTFENQLAIKLEHLATQHEAEIEALREKQATEEEIIQASLNHQLEMEKVKAQETRRIFESQMASYQSIARNIGSAFEAMYEATGEKNKAFLYIAKAAAIAEATMNMHVAITKALAEGGPIQGPIMAGIAMAMGAAAIAGIVSQSFATGGLVQGHSPHKRADNIKANLTAGEFVHQVDAVNYYGTDIMQALNHRRIPKNVLQGLMGGISIPALPARGRRFNQGGPVSDVGSVDDTGGGSGSGTVLELTIINVADPKMVDDYMASSTGKARLLNVVGENASQFQQTLELK